MNPLIIFGANYLIFILVLVWLGSFLLVRKEKRKLHIIFLILTFGLAIAGDKILGLLYNNPRPFVVDGIAPLVKHAADNGFPSGHTLFSMLFAITTFTYNKVLRIILVVLALMVGLSRVLAHVHHTIDIVASVILVLGVTYLAWVLVKKYFKKV